MPKIRFRYCCNYSNILIDLLNENSIKYEISDFSAISCKLVAFHIMSDEKIGKALEKYLAVTEPRPI